MAVWQYTLYLVPNAALANDGSLPGVTYEGMVFDLPLLTFGFTGDQLERSVAKILPRAKAWHQDLRAFGEEDRNEINIWYENESVRAVRIRLDLRIATPTLVKQLVSLGEKLGCSFFDPSGNAVVPADGQAMVSAIKRSPAAHFVSDPRGFLESLSQSRSESSSTDADGRADHPGGH